MRLVTDMNIDCVVSSSGNSFVVIHFRKDSGNEENLVTRALSALEESHEDVLFLEAQVQTTFYTARCLGVTDDGISSVAVLKHNEDKKVTEFLERFDEVNPELLEKQLESWLQPLPSEGR